MALRLGCTAAVAVLALSAAACKKDGITKDSSNTSAGTTTTSSAAATTTTVSAAAATTTAPPFRRARRRSAGATRPACTSAAAPGTDYGAIGGLVTGEKVDILGREGDWYKTNLRTAWAMSAHSSSPPPW